MRAILLAAGLGTRLRPLTNQIPKCLAPINGKPLLEIWLDRYYQYGPMLKKILNEYSLKNNISRNIQKSMPYCTALFLFHF